MTINVNLYEYIENLEDEISVLKSKLNPARIDGDEFEAKYRPSRNGSMNSREDRVETKIRGVDIEERIASIRASMAYEGLELTDNDIEDCRKIFLGEMTADEACAKIVEKYKK